MKTHDQLSKAMMKRPGVKAQVDRIEREEAFLLDTLLKARHEAGLTQADVALRMGTLPPAVARLERSLATGKHSPSIATVRKYSKACGKTSSFKLHNHINASASRACLSRELRTGDERILACILASTSSKLTMPSTMFCDKAASAPSTRPSPMPVRTSLTETPRPIATVSMKAL